jgi:hypothetical protein
LHPTKTSVRVPIIRFGADDRPIAWWEWLFAPIVYPIVLLAMLVVGAALIPVFWFYPELSFYEYDAGTDRQVELMRRYRRLAARVRFWPRVGRALAVPFRRRPTRLWQRRA